MAVTGTGVLEKLLAEPFGPYAEEVTLSKAVGNVTLNNQAVSLECLWLEQGGRTTGLSECEMCQPDYDIKRFRNPVRFLGVLQIQALSWLTPEIVQIIEEELREREHRARRVHDPNGRADIGITGYRLRNLYHTHRKVKVTILATKAKSAVYLLSKHVPNSLCIISKEGDRRYAVNSMHFYTYELSRAYLARYRLLTTLQQLLSLDTNDKNWKTHPTPLEERTPDWFVELYQRYMAYAGPARQHRDIYTDSDSDIEPGKNGAMKIGREHTLRHVSSAEVLSLIAMHGEWLVDQHKQQQQNKWIDVGVWSRWLVDVRRMRKEAARAHLRWGTWDGVEVPLDDDDSMNGNDSAPPAPLRPPKAKKKKSNKKKKDQIALSIRTRPSADAGSDEETDLGDLLAHDYDDDFSPPSSPDFSPPSSPSTPPSPDLIALLPSAFFHPPQVSATLKWICSVEHCYHSINLLNLTDEDLDTHEISAEEKLRLQNREWNVREPWVREAFAYMVDKHQGAHLDEWGIELREVRGQWKAFWRDPLLHRSDRLRDIPKDDRQPAIKTETTET